MTTLPIHTFGCATVASVALLLSTQVWVWAGGIKEEFRPWEKRRVGEGVGDVVVEGGAKASKPVVISGREFGGGRGVSFDFDFGPDLSAANREAEAASLLGPGTYADAANASGGAAVGNFGRVAGHAIVFENVPASRELTLFYNNGTGSGKQCGLYVGTARVGTVKFRDTAGWYVPFVEEHWRGELAGTVKLQVDAGDLAANGGDFCCNVDRVVFGPVPPRPGLEARFKVGGVQIGGGMAHLAVQMAAPKGFAFSLGMEDGAGVRHWSRGIGLSRGDVWQAVSIPFTAFDPPLHAGRVEALLLRAESDGRGGKGTLAVRSMAFSAAWPSDPPADCPFPQSDAIAGIAFTGRHAEYTGADTWYPSWAEDGNLYSPWTDGNVNGLQAGSSGKEATTGNATIIGDDPLQLKVVDQAVYKSDPSPYAGRYPCGSLVYKGVWYYGTYCLHPSGGVPRDGINYNWPWLGPFVGFRQSLDFGRTWSQTACIPEKPLFGESALNGEPVKMGSPHFVDLGRELEHSPDGKAYLVGHGASDGRNRRFAYNSWITGDEIYLARVTPGIGTMNDATQYEYFTGGGRKGGAEWAREFGRIKPTATWRDNMGCVTMTYDAPLRKYLMCVTDGGNTVHYFNTYILESDRMTGPWKLVTYMRRFGEQAYFVNIPSKFISADGRTVWLCYAANFSSGWGGIKFQSRPAGSRYGMCLQEVRLLPGKKAGTSGKSP